MRQRFVLFGVFLGNDPTPLPCLARLMEDLKPNYKKIGNWLPLLVLNESVNRSLVTQNGVKFHPILHLVLGVIFLCQKIRKALFSLCFFLEKGILAITTPPAPPRPITELAHAPSHAQIGRVRQVLSHE